jgi:hypothetical protein
MYVYFRIPDEMKIHVQVPQVISDCSQTREFSRLSY